MTPTLFMQQNTCLAHFITGSSLAIVMCRCHGKTWDEDDAIYIALIIPKPGHISTANSKHYHSENVCQPCINGKCPKAMINTRGFVKLGKVRPTK